MSLIIKFLHLLGKERIRYRITWMNLGRFPGIILINFGLEGALEQAVILLICYLIFFPLHPQKLLEEEMCQFRTIELHLVQGLRPGKFLKTEIFSLNEPNQKIFVPALKQISVFFFSVIHQIQQLEKHRSLHIRVTLSIVRGSHPEKHRRWAWGRRRTPDSSVLSHRHFQGHSQIGKEGGITLYLHCYCASLCNRINYVYSKSKVCKLFFLCTSMQCTNQGFRSRS